MKFAAVIVAAILAGCSIPQNARLGIERDGSAFIEQSGHVETAATVRTDDTAFSLTIPAGSVLRFSDAAAFPGDRADTLHAVTDSGAAESGWTHFHPAAVTMPAESLAWTVTLSADAEMRGNRRTVELSGPKTYPPPLAPTLSQKTSARALWLWRLGLFGGLILTGLGIYWKGPMIVAGGLSVAGASAFGWFVEENPWLLWIFGGGVGIAAAGYLAWHLWLKNRNANRVTSAV